MKTVPLRHLAELRVSTVDKKSYAGGLPVRLCNYTDVYKNDDVGPDPTLMRATASADEVARFRLQVGDTIITKDSEDPAEIGVPAFVRATAPDLVCGYHLAILRPDADLIDPRYFYWSIKGRRSAEHFSVNANGMTRYGLGMDAIKSCPFTIREHREQRRIADFLDERVASIDKVVAARSDQIRAAVEHRISVTRMSVLGLDDGSKTVSTPLPWAQSVSADRELRRLSHLARMGTGHTPSRKVDEYWVDCTIPWLTTGDVHRFRHDQVDVLQETAVTISELGLANSAAVLHPAGTVALSRTASAGFPIIMGRAMATSQDFVTWSCGQQLLPEFLLATLRVMRPYLLGYLSMGSTHKTIYFPNLEGIRIPLPPLPVQRAVISRVQELNAFTRALTGQVSQSVEQLLEYKQALITAAVTGELDVTTASTRLPT